MRNKLQRFPKKGYIGGVCHGLGEHTGIDPILWRILTFFGWVWINLPNFMGITKKRRII